MKISSLCFCLFCVPILSQLVVAQNRARISDTRDLVEKWIQTERIIAQEKNNWRVGKKMLGERIELLQREIESLQGRISEAKQSIAGADQKRGELTQANKKLETASDALGAVVRRLELHTRKLLRRLPDPARERVKLLSQRIPDDTADSKMSLGERFQNIVGILNDVNKFNRQITVTREVRTLSGDTKAEVTSLYIGISKGYYVTANGNAAGIGEAGPEGWNWIRSDDSAAAIARAIAILQNAEVAGYVPLPVHLKH